jgi:Prokaryotic E2 family A
MLSKSELEQLSTRSPAIANGIKFLNQHPAVQEIFSPCKQGTDKSIEIIANIQVGLPSGWMAEGKSPSGVLALEPVTFVFPSDYPIHAPKITLRDDFDRSNPHIYPSRNDLLIVPCIYDGDLNELLQIQGLWGILNQLISWLEKAATRTLIDPTQGWETVRRDNLDSLIIADTTSLRNLVSRKEKYHIFPFVYLKSCYKQDKSQSKLTYVVNGQIIDKTPVDINPLDPDSLRRRLLKQNHLGHTIGTSIAIIVTPGKLPSGQLFISDLYSPENVTNLGELYQRAEEYGCKNALQTAISNSRKCAKYFPSSNHSFPIAIILCARRPHNLIGNDSNIEILPYITEIQLPQLFPQGEQTPVYPAGHHETISTNLLKHLSGETLSDSERDVVLIGGGSLGSKIAIHLARSGTAPSTVIDKGFLSPHNAARHALIPDVPSLHSSWLLSKAQALTEAIAGLGQITKPFIEDFTYSAADRSLLNKLVPKNTWGIINATASLAVRETIAAIPVSQLKSRTIETALFAGGIVGIITIEGHNRNPNCLDLIAEVYEIIRQDEFLRSNVFNDMIQFQSIGQGCGSATMIMSDARISLFAASMSQGIAQFRAHDFPLENGRILIGRVSEDNMGLNWETIDVLSTHLLAIDNSYWKVRISERAHQKICQEYDAYSNTETGGILVGRISEISKTFFVTDVLPSPPDSERLPNKFILGVQDVNKTIREYETSCKSALYCVGTWHTHLDDSVASATDIQTAKVMGDARTMPSVLLIRNKSGYRAVMSKD